jgi:hypothetical protein
VAGNKKMLQCVSTVFIARYRKIKDGRKRAGIGEKESYCWGREN